MTLKILKEELIRDCLCRDEFTNGLVKGDTKLTLSSIELQENIVSPDTSSITQPSFKEQINQICQEGGLNLTYSNIPLSVIQ
ncbi:MAG: hypothetical protein ACFFCQ_04755 [Promethearchaeota archaeon]